MNNLLEPIHCVSNNLHQTARAISRIYGEEMRSGGIQRSQFAILSSLNLLGKVTLGDLAERLFMDRTTLTRNLKPLELQALITIEKSRTDARVREISLTSSGKKKYRKVIRLWKNAQSRILAAFGEDNWTKLESTLKSLRQLDC